MYKNLINKYEYLKKNKDKLDEKSYAFFSGMKELSALGNIKEKTNKEKLSFNINTFVYKMRYALIISVIAISALIISYPFINKRYIEISYKLNLYKDLTYSYVDSNNYLFTEDELTKTVDFTTSDY
jgi:hypothetical protein